MKKAKSDGTEILKENDIIYTFFSDDTFKSFSGIDAESIENNAKKNENAVRMMLPDQLEWLR